MAHAHKVTKAKRRCKGRRKDQGAATMAALKRINAQRAFEEIIIAGIVAGCETDVAEGKYDNWEQKPKPPLGPIRPAKEE
jgi:hypothetical protein